MHPVLFILLKVTLFLGAGLVLLGLLVQCNPRWRIFVCEVLALTSLLFPIVSLSSFTIPLPLLPSIKASSADPQMAALPPQDQAKEEASPSTAPMQEEPALREERQEKSSLRSSSLPTASTVLWSAYALGMIFFLWRFLRCRKAMRRLSNRFSKPDERTNRLFEDLVQDLGLKRRPQLWSTKDEASPFCYGLSPSHIVVPQRLLETSQTESLRLVLRHELSHVANRDLWRAALMNVITMIWWFHPLMWLIRRRHDAAIEELGDRVAADAGDGRDAYRSLLASLALQLQESSRAPAGALGILRTPQIVSRLRRLEAPMSYQPLSQRSRLSFLVTIVPAVILLAMIHLAAQADTVPKKLTFPWIEGWDDTQRNTAHLVVTRALDVLRKHQCADGSLPRESHAHARSDHESGVTALAGAAFLGHGGANKDSPNHEPMMQCLRYVIRCQNASGWFDGSPGKRSSLYHHAISTWFLANLKPHVSEDWQTKIDTALVKAVDLLLEAQAVRKNPANRGGWRYALNSQDSDISCTAWAVRALHAARRVGAEVPDKALADATAYVSSLQLPEGSFTYVAGSAAFPSNVPRAGMGLYVLQLAGEGSSESTTSAAKYILEHSGEPQKAYEFYGVLWSAGAMWLRGGDDAKRYAKWVIEHLSGEQHQGKWPSNHGDLLGTIFGVLALAPPELAADPPKTSGLRLHLPPSYIPYDEPGQEALWIAALASMKPVDSKSFVRKLDGFWALDHDYCAANVYRLLEKRALPDDLQATFAEIGDAVIEMRNGRAVDFLSSRDLEKPRLEIVEADERSGLFRAKQGGAKGEMKRSLYQVREGLWSWYFQHPTIEIPPIVFRQVKRPEYEKRKRHLKRKLG